MNPIKLTSVLTAVLLTLSIPVIAQEGELQEITVTGSRLITDVDSSTSPVQVVDTEELFTHPTDSITDYLQTFLTSNQAEPDIGQEGIADGNQRNQGDRDAGVNLRNLGKENTLVLINGKRTIEHPAFNRSNGWRSVDLNTTIPSIALSNIQILGDGGTSIYGADAVAGAINVTPDYDYQGFKFNIRTQAHEDELGSPDSTFSGMFGTGNDRTNIIFAADYRFSNPLNGFEAGTTDFYADPADDPDTDTLTDLRVTGAHTYAGLVPGGTFGFQLPRVMGMGSNPPIADPLCGDFSALGIDPIEAGINVAGNPGLPGSIPLARGAASSNCQFYVRDGSADVQLDRKQYNLFTAIQHDFTDRIRVQGEVGYAVKDVVDRNFWSRGDNYVARGATLTAEGLFIGGDNPGLIHAASLDPAFDPYLTANGGSGVLPLELHFYNFNEDKLARNKYTQLRGAAEIVWDISDDWSIQSGFVLAENKDENGLPQIARDRMSAALNGTGGVTCPAGASPGDAGCEYWNPFMSAGLPNAETLGLANSQELADFVTPLNTSIFESDYMDFSVSVQGELPFELSGGSVGLVAGYHFRKDDLQITRDSLAQSAGFVNQQGVGTNNIEGSQEVDAFFFELALPVTNTLNIQAAGRYEDSSAGYDSFDPKIGINWQPRDDVTFRGSWGTSFRAPSIIHTAEVDIRERRFLFLADPNNPNNGGAAMMANFRVVSEQSGNPNLQPQSSENLTLGTDLQLNEIFNWDEDRGRLSLGIDYFNITMDDQIVVETTAARLQNPECHILEPTINDPRGEESGVWELLPVNPETDAMGNPALLGSCFAFRDNGTGLYDPNALNVVDTVFGTSVNRPGFDMQSIDFNLTYAVETRFGYFTARPRGTWMIDYEITERVGAAPVDTVGQYFAAGVILPNVAEWRVNVPLGLQFGSQREHQLTFTPRFTSGLDEFSGDGTEDLGSVVYFDLNYAWNAERFLPGLRLSAFVNNITAEHESDVDLVAAAGSLYPPWRRRFGLQMNYSFD